MEEFRVVVAGSRRFNDYEYLEQKLDFVLERKLLTHKVIIHSGMARGADKLGELYAAKNNIPIQQFPADWNTHGKAAGMLRNREMARDADAVVVFIVDDSPGASSMISIAEEKGIPCKVFEVVALDLEES